jgi:uncharacterized damage-inducible protein DinB
MSTNQYASVLAHYNHEANSNMAAVLDKLSEAELSRDRKSYYKSLLGLFSHIAGGEIFMLKNIKAALPGKTFLAVPVLDAELQPGKPAFADYASCKKALDELDAALIAVSESLSDKELEVVGEIHGRQQSVLKSLASAMAHAAHHRGEVAQILDEMGVENDFFMAGISGC